MVRTQHFQGWDPDSIPGQSLGELVSCKLLGMAKNTNKNKKKIKECKLGHPFTFLSFLMAKTVKNLLANTGDTRDMGSTPGSGRSPREGMANQSSILAWEIPWTEEPGGL